MIGHDIVTVANSSPGAGQWIIGDRDEECSGGGDLIGGNLTVTGNAVRVDVSDNHAGTPPYAEGIASNLVPQGNLAGPTFPVVESNFVGRNAACQPGTVEDGDGSSNTVQGNSGGCP